MGEGGGRVDGEDEVSCEDDRWSARASLAATFPHPDIQIQLLNNGETRSKPINNWMSAKQGGRNLERSRPPPHLDELD